MVSFVLLLLSIYWFLNNVFEFHAEFVNYLLVLISFFVCRLFQVPSEKDTLYLHLLFALKDPSVGTLESNFASTVFYAFSALQVQQSSWHGLFSIMLFSPLSVWMHTKQESLENVIRNKKEAFNINFKCQKICTFVTKIL